MSQQQEKNNSKLEQNQHEEPMSHMARVLVIGFFGGVFWSFIGYIAYYFNFTEVGPALVLTPLALGEWKNDVTGQMVGIIIIGLISIAVAIVYNAFFRKNQNLWGPIIFGLIVWGIVFYLLNPIFPGLNEVGNLEVNTIITTICLYVLYGVFIGYSIFYDANEVTEHRVSYSNK